MAYLKDMKSKIIILFLSFVLLLSSCTPSYAKKNTIPIKHYNKIERKLGNVTKIKKIDHYKRWYCYYVYANGDIYVITLVKGKVDIIQQLN